MRFYRIVIVLVIASFFSTSVFAQSKKEKLQQLLKTYSDFGYFNGCVLISFKDSIILDTAYGLANREWIIENTPLTKFRIASLTKQFTGMLTMQMVNENRIELDGKITDYLNFYPKETGDQITIHQLLTHSSGIPNFTSFPNFYQEYQNKDLEHIEFLEIFNNKPLNFNPGTAFEYSNSNYYLLGTILEVVTKKSFDQLLFEYILQPLNMRDTGMEYHKDILQNRATGYNKSGNQYLNSQYVNIQLPFAAGSMYSTTNDLYKWHKALMTNTLLPDTLMKIYFKAHQPLSFGDYKAHYAYGWGIHKHLFANSGEHVLIHEHGGDMFGFTSHIVRLPEDKGVIILLSNTWRSDLESIKLEVLNILYDKPFALPKPDIINVLDKKVFSTQNPNCREIFYNLKQTNEYIISEEALNRYGYSLLNKNENKIAIEIFKINTEEYPNSSNVYDSLGEAYFVDGQIKNALTNYKKSLTLNLNNENAKMMIDRMEKKN